MAIYHIAYHGCKGQPSQEQFDPQAATLNAAFAAAALNTSPWLPATPPHPHRLLTSR